MTRGGLAPPDPDAFFGLIHLSSDRYPVESIRRRDEDASDVIATSAIDVIEAYLTR